VHFRYKPKVIRTYEQRNIDKQNNSFTLSDKEDIYTKQNGKLEDPHKYNYFTILTIKKAKGLHKIDLHNNNLDASKIYFIAPR
jgi:AraC family transcriptional regulator, transcriptional activator of pobA